MLFNNKYLSISLMTSMGTMWKAHFYCDIAGMFPKTNINHSLTRSFSCLFHKIIPVWEHLCVVQRSSAVWIKYLSISQMTRLLAMYICQSYCIWVITAYMNNASVLQYNNCAFFHLLHLL